jgi:hypothetical protein
MKKYLIIREGRSAANSQAIFVSDDAELIEIIGQLIAERLAADDEVGHKAVEGLAAKLLAADAPALSLVRKPD